MKKSQIAMLGATLAGLAVLIGWGWRGEQVQEHRPGAVQIQEREEQKADVCISFQEIEKKLEAEPFPCSNLSIAYQSDYEIRLRGSIDKQTIKSCLPNTEVGYNALIALLPDSSACTIDLGLAADSGTLNVWCTGVQMEGMNLPEGIIPQILLERFANSLWPSDAVQQLNSVRVTQEEIQLFGQS